MTTGTPLAPTLGERQLLAQFLRGLLSLDRLIVLADALRQTAPARDEIGQLAAYAA